VGNTKNLWPKFLLTNHNNQTEPPMNPLDDYIEHSLEKSFLPSLCLQFKLAPSSVRIHYTHRRYQDGNKYIAFQQLADYCGLALWDPITCLSVHPTYGPWFALRALVSVQMPIGDGRELMDALPQPILGDSAQLVALRKRLVESFSGTPLFTPGSRERRRLKKQMPGLLAAPGFDWHEWVRVRDEVTDACRVGHQWRYGDQQLRYHYTKNYSVLKAGTDQN
jgi:methylmalonic aciduria homocystinuria type C protein